MTTQEQMQEQERLHEADYAVAAAMVASGIGSAVLGLLVVLSELSDGIKAFLKFHEGAGPLSGKTTLAVLAFLLSWFVLHRTFKTKPLAMSKAFIITLALVALGLLLTFPPIFEIFAE